MTNLANGYGAIGAAASDSDTYAPPALVLAGKGPTRTSKGILLDQNAALAAFTLVGRITASGKLTPCDKDSNDGSQVPVGITICDYPDTGADIPNVTFYRDGCWNFDAIGKSDWTLAALRIACETAGVELEFEQVKTATPTEPA